jgi:hypothetical protein
MIRRSLSINRTSGRLFGQDLFVRPDDIHRYRQLLNGVWSAYLEAFHGEVACWPQLTRSEVAEDVPVHLDRGGPSALLGMVLRYVFRPQAVSKPSFS